MAKENARTVARIQLSAAGVVLSLLASACIACCAYALFLTHIIIRNNYIPRDVDRLLQKAALLDRLAEADQRSVLVFGSSIVLAGVDAQILEQSLPPAIHAYNIGESAAGVRRLMLNVEAIGRAKPATVVCCFARDQLLVNGLDPLPSELLIAFAYADYIDAAVRTPAWVFERLSEDEIQAIPSGLLGKQLACRTLWLRYLEGKVRERSRPDLRLEGFASDFRAPWVYREPTPPDRLEREIRRKMEVLRSARFAVDAEPLRVLEACLRRLRELSVQTVIVLTPDHPKLHDALEPATDEALRQGLADLCGRCGAGLIQLPVHLLTEQDYIDAVHPDADGRAKLSARLGRELSHRLPQ
jgi:hypothetical protein